MLNYRNYQQVLDLNDCANHVPVRRAKRSTKNALEPIKRRTKTGCLRCRIRKKKCDENRVNGKCDACTRNFLECSWPEPACQINDTTENSGATSRTTEMRTTEMRTTEMRTTGKKSDIPVTGLRTPEASPKLTSVDYKDECNSPLSHSDIEDSNLGTNSGSYALTKHKSYSKESGISKKQLLPTVNKKKHTFVITSLAKDLALQTVNRSV